MTPEGITRRGSLVKLAGAVVAAATGWKVVESAEEASGAGPAAVSSGLVSCVLSPEQTEGPYYLPGDLRRRNVTEGKPGMPLTLRLTVVDVSTCKPIRGAAVDIWHCDAGGVYSGVAAQATVGQTFLRGIQKTDAKGIVTFKTIYPGWYPGRTVHIHVRVSLGGNIVHTGQLYFADSTTDAVYRSAPYNARPGRDPRNGGDAIYRNGGKRSTLKVKKAGSAYTGSLSMGIQRSWRQRGRACNDARVAVVDAETSLVEGYEALATADWERARAAFAAAVEQVDSPDALDGLGRALWWLRDGHGAIVNREHAYAGYRRDGKLARAARIALWLSREYALVFSNDAAARGWLARAERLLRDVAPGRRAGLARPGSLRACP